MRSVIHPYGQIFVIAGFQAPSRGRAGDNRRGGFYVRPLKETRKEVFHL